MHAPQREKTADLLRTRGLSRALFADPDSVRWLTGFAPPIQLGWHHFAGGPAVVWYEDGHFTLLVLDAHAEAAGAFDAEPDGTLRTYPGYTIEQPITSPEHLAAALVAVVGRAGGNGRIGVEQHALPAFLHAALTAALPAAAQAVPIDRWLVPLRMVKTPEELAKLRRNFALTDLGHRVAREVTRPGLREIDVWTEIHRAIERDAGVRVPLGNDCIVGYRTGNNIGGWPLGHVIREDTALVVDLSTAHQGYWSDSCGTYYATEPTPRQRALHRVVQDALDYAVSLVRPGVAANEVDRQVRGFMARAGYPVYPHHTGHGVGVSVHEEPRIVPYNDTVLEAGMVIMLEPGIYFPGETSVRLEHGLLITPDGAEVLTTHIDRL
jgi:Xaa-Pro dipeptidase